MKTLMVLMVAGQDERRGRIFDEDLSRFNGAEFEGNDLGDKVYPMVFDEEGCYIHDDWAVNKDLIPLINAKEWDCLIFVDQW